MNSVLRENSEFFFFNHKAQNLNFLMNISLQISKDMYLRGFIKVLMVLGK